jgi:hypothetical protein
MIWGALSDEKAGLTFAIATGPRQRSQIHYSYLIIYDQAKLAEYNKKICNKNCDKASTCVELG